MFGDGGFVRDFNLVGDNMSPDMFWGEIPPCEHMVQLWDNEAAFLDTLEGFVAGGLRAGDGVIIIATPEHREQLRYRLARQGLMDGAHTGKYVALDADETLNRFMKKGWPDDTLFKFTILDALEQAAESGRRVRAFGEMVAILWARGEEAATVRLECLWHDLCREAGFSLLCAYPQAGFKQNAQDALKQICDAHSRVIPASPHRH
jgi:hypothetical protein